MLKYVDCTKTTDKQTYLTRKTTGFKSLRLNCWEIDQVTPKNKINFLVETFKSNWPMYQTPA